MRWWSCKHCGLTDGNMGLHARSQLAQCAVCLRVENYETCWRRNEMCGEMRSFSPFTVLTPARLFMLSGVTL